MARAIAYNSPSRRRLSRTSFVLGLVILWASAAAIPARGDTIQFRYDDETEEAAGGLFVVDTSTCSRGVATNLFVRSQRSTILHDGTTTEGSGTHLRMDVYDGCQGGFTASYDATTDIQSLQIDPNLGFASLHVTVPARDSITGAVVDITLDLVWMAVDNPYHDVLSGVEHFDSATSVGHTRTMIRRALTAGTLTIGGVTVPLELEDYGAIQKVVTSNTEVTRQNH